ncbi:MAG: aldolase [Acetobacteraceae bacterium]|nr:aldolase [Acetobacteraceae bacterium]
MRRVRTTACTPSSPLELPVTLGIRDLRSESGRLKTLDGHARQTVTASYNRTTFRLRKRRPARERCQRFLQPTSPSSVSDSWRGSICSTFLKTPTIHATEILGDVGFDFVVLDEEHAPFDRIAIDHILLAARAAGTAALVRVADPRPSSILSALDGGAAGVLVPHVDTPAKAREIAAAARYRNGRRGFSSSPRAAGYGRLGMRAHIEAADAATTVIAMIEDPEALDVIEAIAAAEGIDGFFIGRGDLTVALGEFSTEAPAVRAATEKIIAAGRSAGKPICLMTGSTADATAMTALGATAFIVASDQGFLRQAAMKAFAEFGARAA